MSGRGVAPRQRGPVRTAAIALLVLTAAPALAAGDPAQHLADFQAANERALSGDLEGAIGLYRSLAEQGVEHPDLELNLGNALARKGELVEAVVAYERALRLAPGDADARLNLAAVRARLSPKSSDEPVEIRSLVDAIEPIVAPLPQDGLAWASVVLGWAFFLLLGLRRSSSKHGERARLAAVPVFLLWCAVLLPAGGQALVRFDPRGVVTAKNAELKGGPHPRFPSITPIRAGERVRLRKEDSGWREVQDEQGRIGWLPADQLKEI